MTAVLDVSTTLTKERVHKAVQAILGALGEPQESPQREALAAFKDEDYQTVKRLAATYLGDYYCKALGYLGSAYKLTPNTDTILAESARAAADFVRERTLSELGAAIAEALG